MTRKDAALIAQEVVRELKAQGLVDDKVIGIDECAEILGCKPQTVYNNIDDIPHTKFGKHLRFFRSDIYKLLRRN